MTGTNGARSTLSQEKRALAIQLHRKKACNVSAVCDEMGISRPTWYEWKQTDPDFTAAIKANEEAMIELAESQLMKNILAGKEVSLIFFLKNKAPEKWRDRKDVDLSGELKLVEVDR